MHFVAGPFIFQYNSGQGRVCVIHRFSVFPTFSQVFTVSRDLGAPGAVQGGGVRP